MGLFDASAMPDHLDEKGEIENAFPDDSQYGNSWFGKAWRWFKKTTKVWAAFGPRSPVGVAVMVAPWALILWVLGWPIYHWSWTWWALWPFYPVLRKWRKKPFIIAAVCGEGSWRLEKLSGGQASAPARNFFWKDLEGEYYMSRVQPWVRWHVALLWPLELQVMAIPRKGDVQPAMVYNDMDGKVVFFYGPSHFDADWVHWCPSGYVGRNPK